MNAKDIELFETILNKSQTKLKKFLAHELRRKGMKTTSKQGFLYAEGQIPIMLVAHMDTVHRNGPGLIFYTRDLNFCMSPNGIGGDDRCGVYMILKLLEKYRPHVLFCEDEESGGIGASLFSKSSINPDVNFIIELDRQGRNDAVFYDCDNEDFVEHITSFDFKEDYGTFSDISFIAPALKIAAVNLSCGYYHQHTTSEYINIPEMEHNIKEVGKILTTPSQKYEYVEKAYSWAGWHGGTRYSSDSKWGGYGTHYRFLMPLDAVCPSGFYIDFYDKTYRYVPGNKADLYAIDGSGGLWFLEEGDCAISLEDVNGVMNDDGTDIKYNFKYGKKYFTYTYDEYYGEYSYDDDDDDDDDADNKLAAIDAAVINSTLPWGEEEYDY